MLRFSISLCIERQVKVSVRIYIVYLVVMFFYSVEECVQRSAVFCVVHYTVKHEDKHLV